MLYAGGNLYLFMRLWQALHSAPLWCRIAIIVLCTIAALALFLAIGLRNSSMPATLHRILFSVGSVWLVFLLYMTLSLALCDVLHLFVPKFTHGVWYALGITSLILIYGYVNYRHPRVEHVTITANKPLDVERYRLVMISDVHLGYGTNAKDLARYVEMINEQQGDAVVIVGDLIDNSITPVRQADMCRKLDRINAPDGIYMVAGNHEYISGIEPCEEYLATTAVRLVRDTVVTLPAGIELVARDDRMNRHRATLEELLSHADSSRVTIVLDHQPYDISLGNDLGVNIYLSGHTHRGQVWPLSWLTDAIYDQSHGYRKWSTTHAIVSCGLSLWGPPFRIGTHSDLYVIDILSAE